MRKQYQRQHSIIGAVLVALLLGACASMSPEQRAAVAYLDANTIYEETIMAAGEAQARNPTPETAIAVERLREPARLAEAALRTARTGLLAYLNAAPGSPEHVAATLLADAQKAEQLAKDLKRLWSAAKKGV